MRRLKWAILAFIILLVCGSNYPIIFIIAAVTGVIIFVNITIKHYKRNHVNPYYKNPKTPQELERSKVTPSLRYDVLKRDNFRCQLCGKSGKDILLEVDHILPISKGGKTEWSNLRTLCKECNRGKGAKYDYTGIN